MIIWRSLVIRSFYVLGVWGLVAFFGQANPVGEDVQHGEVQFERSGSNLKIRQLSQRAIIHWSDFSIQEGELTRFIQSGGDAAVLNRVLGGDPSEIYGRLEANGRVYLINPSGILVGKSGVIQTQGFIGSTLDVSDGDFLDGGDMRFEGNSEAVVKNLGRIGVSNGDVYLIAREVQNHGEIRASEGVAGLAAGGAVYLSERGDSQNGKGRHLFVKTGDDFSKGVVQSGVIEAAQVELAAAGGNIYALSIKNSGRIRATGYRKEGGRIFLMGGDGRLVQTKEGELMARSSDGGGGFIETSAKEVDLAGKVDAGRGGEWLIDPVDVTITTGMASSLSGSLRGGTNVRVEADRNITVAALIRSAGSGNLQLYSDLNADGVGTVVFTTGGVDFQGGSGDVELFYNPTSYTSPTNYSGDVMLGSGQLYAWMFVHDLSDLIAINSNLRGMYALSGNIDASSTAVSGFTPIGRRSYPGFRGIFNGQGFSINDLTVSGGDYVGLFSRVRSGAEVRNLNLNRVSVFGRRHVGGLAGRSEGVVENVRVTGVVKGDPTGAVNNVGGLVGFLNGGVIKDSSAEVEVTVDGATGLVQRVGGLVGYQRNGEIRSSDASGDVEVRGVGGRDVRWIGGLVGYDMRGLIFDSVASGAVHAEAAQGVRGVGGFIGGLNNVTVQQGEARGEVSVVSHGDDAEWVGGFVGYQARGSIEESRASGAVSVEAFRDVKRVGGFVGYSGRGSITGSHATGSLKVVSTDDDVESVGGFAGYQYQGSIKESRASGAVSVEAFRDVKRVGGFIGNQSRGVIEESYTSSAVDVQSGRARDVGGFAGYYARGVIREGQSSGNVSVETTGDATRVGGFSGYVGNGTIERGEASGAVSVVSSGEDVEWVGGFAGYQARGVIEKSKASGAVSVEAFRDVKRVGGFLGYGNQGRVESSYGSGNLTAVSTNGDVESVGGFSGYQYRGVLQDSYASGGVSVDAFDSASQVGGFVGYHNQGAIEDSYTISGLGVQGARVSDVGGFIGVSRRGSYGRSFYLDGSFEDAGNVSDLIGVERKTLAELADAATYAGWDFLATWVIDERRNGGLPYHQWDFKPLDPVDEPLSEDGGVPRVRDDELERSFANLSGVRELNREFSVGQFFFAPVVAEGEEYEKRYLIYLSSRDVEQGGGPVSVWAQ